MKTKLSNSTIIVKQDYLQPHIERLVIDSEISLQLQSGDVINDPDDPGTYGLYHGTISSQNPLNA